MPLYKQSAVTAKEGINFIRSVVENCGSLFIKIEQESDLGVDGLIEFIRDERPLNKQIAAQIKSGASYYSSKSNECAFPIGKHRDYWKNHPLPVFGLVYTPKFKTAYWINIKRFLKDNPSSTSIRFPATKANEFSLATFKKFFLPGIAGETPELELTEAISLANSKEPSERYLGLLVLFRKHANNISAWSLLIQKFIELPKDEIPPILVYWLAHIPGHGDIFYIGNTASPETRAHAKALLEKFDINTIIKLLQFIDPEEQIARGTLGQSVEAIISSLPSAPNMLREITTLPEIEMHIREFAILILAINEGANALNDITRLQESGSWVAGEIASHIKEHGSINPYT